MPLTDSVHEFLESEYRFAAKRVLESGTLNEKVYYFSVFFGQAGRQLNMHWDDDLALIWSVGQHLCGAINGRLAQGPGEYPTHGFPDGFANALDEVSQEMAGSFEGGKIDTARLYAALRRSAELTYLTTGNGIYLYEKGFIKLLTGAT